MPATNHRRVACSFRDQYLFQIFQISLTSLGQLKNDGKMGILMLKILSLFSTMFLTFCYHDFEHWDYILCSCQSIARIGTCSIFEMFIIWFCGDFCWWKFRWVWHSSGIWLFYFYLWKILHEFLQCWFIYYLGIWWFADSITLEACFGGFFNPTNIFWLLCHYKTPSFKGGLYMRLFLWLYF